MAIAIAQWERTVCQKYSLPGTIIPYCTVVDLDVESPAPWTTNECSHVSSLHLSQLKLPESRAKVTEPLIFFDKHGNGCIDKNMKCLRDTCVRYVQRSRLCWQLFCGSVHFS